MIALLDGRAVHGEGSRRGERPGAAVEAARPPVAAIGFFDGLHRGHQAMISELVAWAGAVGGRPVAVTFDRHPSEVLGRRPAVPVTSLLHRLVLLARAGVDTALVLPFDRELAAWPPEEFIRRILLDRLGARRLLLGFDSAFGRGRTGTYEFIKAREAELGIEVRRAEVHLLEGRRVSSTLVREALREGDLPLLESLLGRPFSVLGEVKTGERRGRTLGFPTANLILPSGSLPPRGVYFARAAAIAPPLEEDGRLILSGDRPPFLPAVVNVGRRPTFGAEGEVILEAHILDFEGDLYGRNLEVEFLRRHRGEIEFPGIEALREQIRRDVEARRSYDEAHGERTDG